MTLTTTQEATLRTAIAAMLGTVFIFSGLAKVTMTETPTVLFALWGLPEWLMVVTGAVELAAGALLMARFTRLGAALGLMTVMTAALFTHIVHGEFAMALLPGALLPVLGWLGYHAWPIDLPMVRERDRVENVRERLAA